MIILLQAGPGLPCTNGGSDSCSYDDAPSGFRLASFMSLERQLTKAFGLLNNWGRRLCSSLLALSTFATISNANQVCNWSQSTLSRTKMAISSSTPVIPVHFRLLSRLLFKVAHCCTFQPTMYYIIRFYHCHSTRLGRHSKFKTTWRRWCSCYCPRWQLQPRDVIIVPTTTSFHVSITSRSRLYAGSLSSSDVVWYFRNA